jgi:hypothetical protein
MPATRSLLAAFSAIAIAVTTASCVFAPVAPPRGLIYTKQVSPLFPGGRPGTKEGRASSHSILFLVGWGNSGLARAMEKGEISEVRHTDYEIFNVLLVYQKYTTIVKGE